MSYVAEVNVRRSQLQVRLEVLKVVKDGEHKPTRIMYKSNMSWNLTQRVLEDLVNKQFLTITYQERTPRTRRRYYLTEKGENFLETIIGISDLF